eukprot:912261-Alexandrium_andersonii.AAC.1
MRAAKRISYAPHGDERRQMHGETRGLRGTQAAGSPTSPEHGLGAHCQRAAKGRRRACFRGAASPRSGLVKACAGFGAL